MREDRRRRGVGRGGEWVRKGGERRRGGRGEGS